MKTMTLIKGLTAAFVLAGFTSNSFGLTQAEANNILFIKQEEKLARDTYQALLAKSGPLPANAVPAASSPATPMIVRMFSFIMRCVSFFGQLHYCPYIII